MRKKQYLIENYLKENDVKNLSDDEVILYYKWAEKDYVTYLSNRSNETHIDIFGTNFMPPGGHGEVKKRNKRYDETHKEDKNRITHNRNFMKKTMKQKNLSFSTPKSIEDIQGDPLDYYPSLLQKKHLVFIAQELHLKSSGTVPELIRILKDNIGKSERKEVISKILA